MRLTLPPRLSLSWWTLGVWALCAWAALPFVYRAARQPWPRKTIDVGDSADSWYFSNDGRRLRVTYGVGAACSHWDMATGEPIKGLKTRELYRHWMDQLAWLPNGDIVVAEPEGKDEIRVREITTGRELARLKGHWNTANLYIAISPNAATLLTQSETEWELWDLQRERLISKRDWPPRWGPFVTYSPNGRMLLNRLQGEIYDASSGARVGKVGSGYLEPGQFSGDGRFMATHGPDHTAELWEYMPWDKWRLLASYPLPPSYCETGHEFIGLSLHGKYLVICHFQGQKLILPAWVPDFVRRQMRDDEWERTYKVDLFDARTGRLLTSLPACAAQFPDTDDTLVTCERNSSLLKIWDMPPARVLPAFVPWVVLASAVGLTVACGWKYRRKPSARKTAGFGSDAA